MAATVPKEKRAVSNFVGDSGLRVSNICLGCMTFGPNWANSPRQLTEDSSHKIMDRFVEWGGYFFDTADWYGPYHSENIVGKWLERRPRDNFVVATKVRFPIGVRENRNSLGLSRRHITTSITRSLERLRTSYVDIYQTHMWDAGTNIEETLRTLNDLVRAEKVRYVGVSNVNGWQMQKIMDTSEKLGLNPVISLQQQYSLLCRESELEAFQVCKGTGVGVFPWSPLSGGVLTGKIKRGVKPTEGRVGWLAQDATMKRYAGTGGSHTRWDLISDRSFNTVETAEAIAKERGCSLPQVALRWLLQKDVVSSVIIGATSTAQIDDNMGAANGWSLSKEEMDQLDKVSAPQQIYPYGQINSQNILRENKMSRDYIVRSKY